jgi:hypothetical protein
VGQSQERVGKPAKIACPIYISLKFSKKKTEIQRGKNNIHALAEDIIDEQP